MKSLSALWLLAGSLAVLGCATGHDLDLVIGEGPLGSVYLERIPGTTVRAAHPVKLDTALLASTLRGVMVEERAAGLQSLLGGHPAPTPAFSADEIAFLAPLLADGLARAATDQQVGFLLTRRTTSTSYSDSTGAGLGSSEPPLGTAGLERTSGSLFVHGLSLHVLLHEYHRRLERPDTINMANRRLPDPTGLQQKTMSFVPASVLRPASYQVLDSDGVSLIIDYESLARLPAALIGTAATAESARVPAPATPSMTNVPPPQGTSEAELKAIREDMKKKETELDALRKELDEIRRQMADQQAERDSPKRKQRTAPKGGIQ
jgi:hypothetical protein